MAFMSGSPVLTEQKFNEQTAEARQAGGDGSFGGRSDSAPYTLGPPPSTGFDTMTVGGSVTATSVLMILLVAAAAFGWSQVAQTTPVLNKAGEVVSGPTMPSWIFLAMIVGVVFGLITSFKPKAARITAPLYALAMGTALGAISAVYNHYWNGIVTQAVFATLGIFVAMLFLYVTRIIKVTNRFVMIVTAATLGIFLMYLLSFIVGLFGVQVTFLTQPSPLSILISVGIIIIAALNLAIDFAFIETASQHGAPKYMEWYAGFGVMVTLVWIYLEVLRLLALLNRR